MVLVFAFITNHDLNTLFHVDSEMLIHFYDNDNNITTTIDVLYI